MGTAIGKIIEILVDFLKRNYKRPKLWIGLIVLMILIILLLPYIDSNFFYYSRMEKRIDILERVMELDQDKVNSNQAYIDEYENILQEMKQQNERSINSLMNKLINQIDSFVTLSNSGGNQWVKAITGAFWFLIVTICVPFMNTFKKRSDRIMTFGLMVCLTAIVGWGFASIPIIIAPWVNYIVFPILQIVIMVWLVNKRNAKKKNNL